jgi:uncharacterized protein
MQFPHFPQNPSANAKKKQAESHNRTRNQCKTPAAHNMQHPEINKPTINKGPIVSAEQQSSTPLKVAVCSELSLQLTDERRRQQTVYATARNITRKHMTIQKKEPLKVIVDSNALYVPLEYKIDIFTELQALLNRNIQLILLSPVKRELETLAQKSSPKTRRNAAFALQMAEKLTLVNVPQHPNEPVDEAILRIAKQWNAPVFTNDKQLKRKLRDISTPVIYVRAKTRLQIEGLIT